MTTPRPAGEHRPVRACAPCFDGLFCLGEPRRAMPLLPEADGWQFTTGDPELDDPTSAAPCEACGDPAPGARVHMIAYRTARVA